MRHAPANWSPALALAWLYGIVEYLALIRARRRH
jgi:hypothetical protein